MMLAMIKRLLIVLTLLTASTAISGTSSASYFDPFLNQAPFLKGKAWQPDVRLTGPFKDSSEQESLRLEVSKSVESALKKRGISTTPEPTVFTSESSKDGVSAKVTLTYRPTLQVLVFLNGNTVTCQATASDVLPDTKAAGIVWQSPFKWLIDDADVVKHFTVANRIKTCTDGLVKHFADALEAIEKSERGKKAP